MAKYFYAALARLCDAAVKNVRIREEGTIAVYREPKRNITTQRVKTAIVTAAKQPAIITATFLGCACIVLGSTVIKLNGRVDALSQPVTTAAVGAGVSYTDVTAAYIASATDTVVSSAIAVDAIDATAITTTIATTTATTTTTPTTTTPTTTAKKNEVRVYEVNDDLVNFVKKWEGYEPELYYCESHYPTIGYGHVLVGDDWDSLGSAHLSEKDASDLLKHDLNGVYKRQLDKFIRENNLVLTNNQYNALLSFAYNCGENVWYRRQNFTIRNLLLEYRVGSDIPDADIKAAFNLWNKGSDGVLKGLVNRRREEGEMFCKD